MKFQKKIERVIYDGQVSRQHPPYYETIVKGKSVEYGSLMDAQDAFVQSSSPKSIVRIDVTATTAHRRTIQRG
jgi:hypothetical protein